MRSTPTDVRGYNVYVPHGTYARYTHGACRCDECREANRLACWLRRNGLGPGRLPWRHNVHGYLTGCRCGVCREDHNYWHRRCYHSRKLKEASGMTSPAASSLTRAAPRGA